MKTINNSKAAKIYSILKHFYKQKTSFAQHSKKAQKFLHLRAPNTTMAEFANIVDPDDGS